MIDNNCIIIVVRYFYKGGESSMIKLIKHKIKRCKVIYKLYKRSKQQNINNVPDIWEIEFK